MSDNNLPEANGTYIRFNSLGYNEYESKKRIGQFAAVETYNIMNHQKLFDQKRSVKSLKALPKEPFD